MTLLRPSNRLSDRPPELSRASGEGRGERQGHVFNLGTIRDRCGASSTYEYAGICADRSSFAPAGEMRRSRFAGRTISPNFGPQLLSQVKTFFFFPRTFHRSSEPVRGPLALAKTPPGPRLQAECAPKRMWKGVREQGLPILRILGSFRIR